jgi:hypothetical protein
MTIRIETEDGRSFDAFTNAEVLTSIVRSSEASFEVGDDGSWRDLADLAALGQGFVAYVDETQRLRGRVEVLNSDLTPERSSTVRFVVRTAISDLETNEVDPGVQVQNATIKEVIEQANGRRAVAPAPQNWPPRITYRGDVSRSIMTGKRARGGKAAPNLKPMTTQQAAPQAGELIKEFLDRHLMRHGLMIWDDYDGGLVVAAPDDEQEPIYHFRCLKGSDAVYNNCSVVGRTRDATGAPTHLSVYGKSGGKDFRRAKISAKRINEELVAAGFDRRMSIIEDGIKTKDMAERTAARAFAERVRKVESVSITTDGHSHEDQSGRVSYASDTAADLIFETVGGPLGNYYVEQVLSRVSVEAGETTQLQLVRSGTWKL